MPALFEFFGREIERLSWLEFHTCISLIEAFYQDFAKQDFTKKSLESLVENRSYRS